MLFNKKMISNFLPDRVKTFNLSFFNLQLAVQFHTNGAVQIKVQY